MHFTYNSSPDNTKLHQGDLIKRTDGLEDEILRKFYPTFFNENKCDYFCVLTQSCDLEKRNGQPCKADTITIASLWPLKVAIQKELRKFQYNPIEKKLGFVNDKIKPKLNQFIERLFNNNEVNYFFYYREPLHGVEEDYCVFLEHTITLDSKFSYEILLERKTLQLKESFQNKLGHIVGELFSRVATEDWTTKACAPEVFKRYIKEPLLDQNLVLWVDALIHKKVLDKLKDITIDELTSGHLESAIKETKITKSERIEESIAIVKKTMADLEIDEPVIEKLAKRLKNNPKFVLLIK